MYNPFNLSILRSPAWFIACQIDYLNLNISFVAVFIYASTQSCEKNDFLLDIYNYINGISSFVIILGDFNELSSGNDQCGGAIFSLSKTQRFYDLLFNTNCIDFPFLGQPFTWRKSVIIIFLNV